MNSVHRRDLLMSRWRTAMVPSGYQPGALLNRLIPNLAPYECQRTAAAQLRLTLRQGVTIDVCEQPQSLFLAHIVSALFSCQGTTSLTESVTLSVIQRGWWRRTAIGYRIKEKNASARRLLAALRFYPELAATLTALDFRRITLTLRAGRWMLGIKHFAASEVVSRLPASRLYLKLLPEQRRLLLSALLMFSQLMSHLNQMEDDEVTAVDVPALSLMQTERGNKL